MLTSTCSHDQWKFTYMSHNLKLLESLLLQVIVKQHISQKWEKGVMIPKNSYMIYYCMLLARGDYFSANLL